MSGATSRPSASHFTNTARRLDQVTVGVTAVQRDDGRGELGLADEGSRATRSPATGRGASVRGTAEAHRRTAAAMPSTTISGPTPATSAYDPAKTSLDGHAGLAQASRRSAGSKVRFSVQRQLQDARIRRQRRGLLSGGPTRSPSRRGCRSAGTRRRSCTGTCASTSTSGRAGISGAIPASRASTSTGTSSWPRTGSAGGGHERRDRRHRRPGHAGRPAPSGRRAAATSGTSPRPTSGSRSMAGGWGSFPGTRWATSRWGADPEVTWRPTAFVSVSGGVHYEKDERGHAVGRECRNGGLDTLRLRPDPSDDRGPDRRRVQLHRDAERDARSCTRSRSCRLERIRTTRKS